MTPWDVTDFYWLCSLFLIMERVRITLLVAWGTHCSKLNVDPSTPCWQSLAAHHGSEIARQFSFPVTEADFNSHIICKKHLNLKFSVIPYLDDVLMFKLEASNEFIRHEAPNSW